MVGRAAAEGTPVCLEVAACSGRGLVHTDSVGVAGVEEATGGERAWPAASGQAWAAAVASGGGGVATGLANAEP